MAGMNWHFPRPKEAQKLLNRLEMGSGEPLRITAGSGQGKTWLMRFDVAPMAKSMGMQPIYVDLMADVTNPSMAVVAALQSTHDYLVLPQNKVEEIARTPIKGVGILGLKMDFLDGSGPVAPASPLLLIDHLLDRLCRVAKKPLLVLIDEAQFLAVAREGRELAQALRSALNKRNGKVFAIFTGSGEHAMREVFGRADAPLYQFGTACALPKLDRDFVQSCAKKFKERTELDLELAALETGFDALGREPRPFVQMMTELAVSHSTNVTVVRDDILRNMRKDFDFPKLFEQLSPLERHIVVRVADGKQPGSRGALQYYAGQMHRERVLLTSVERAMEKLKTKGIFADHSSVKSAVFRTPHFAEWISSQKNLFTAYMVPDAPALEHTPMEVTFGGG